MRFSELVSWCGVVGGARRVSRVVDGYYSPHYLVYDSLQSMQAAYRKTMSSLSNSRWTHLIRFVANEDNETYLGQPVDVTRDLGLDLFEKRPVKAYPIQGNLFSGKVNTSFTLTVKQLLSPISRDQCNYVRCVGLNYTDHAEEAGLEAPKVPILFTKPRNSIIGPYPSTINIPVCAQDGTSDYEGELCVVIGKSGKDIKEEDALDHVLGYTCANDVSARNLQFEQSQWSFSKGLDDSLPLGPVLVSPEIIHDPQTLRVTTTYNGKIVQEGTTKSMIFPIRKLVSFFSQGTTLEAGTVIVTGTPAGIGFTMKPRVFLQDGSDIRVNISQIGTLVNKVSYQK